MHTRSGQKLLKCHPSQLTRPLPFSDMSLQHTAYLNSLCSTMFPSLCPMSLLISFKLIESSISVQPPTIHLLTGLWNDWYRRSSSRWSLVSMVGWHCISCRIFWWHTEVLHMLLLDNHQHPCSWDDQFKLGLICCALKWARRCEELKLVRSIIMMLMLTIVNLQCEVGWWYVMEETSPTVCQAQLWNDEDRFHTWFSWSLVWFIANT